MSNFESVKKFMQTFGQQIKEKAEFPDEKITKLRYELIEEELQEQFPYLEEWGCGNHLYDKVQRLVNTVTTIRSFKEQFNDQVAELKELNLEEEISKLKELGVEIGEGNEWCIQLMGLNLIWRTNKHMS